MNLQKREDKLIQQLTQNMHYARFPWDLLESKGFIAEEGFVEEGNILHFVFRRSDKSYYAKKQNECFNNCRVDYYALMASQEAVDKYFDLYKGMLKLSADLDYGTTSTPFFKFPHYEHIYLDVTFRSGTPEERGPFRIEEEPVKTAKYRAARAKDEEYWKESIRKDKEKMARKRERYNERKKRKEERKAARAA